MDAVVGSPDDILMLQVIVVQLCFLVSPVFCNISISLVVSELRLTEPIPLTAALGVDMDLVVMCNETEGLPVQEFVLWFLSQEARLVDFV